MNPEIIGYIAASLSSISLIPEVKKALHTHHLKDVSLMMLSLICSSSIIWVAYGFHVGSYPLVLSDGVNLISSSLLIALKFHYDKNGQPVIKKTNTQLQPALEIETEISQN